MWSGAGGSETLTWEDSRHFVLCKHNPHITYFVFIFNRYLIGPFGCFGYEELNYQTLFLLSLNYQTLFLFHSYQF